MIKCVIIDDEPAAINVLENYISRMPFLQLIGSAIDPLTGLDLIQKCKADLVFLDIQMDEMNGIEVMKLLNPNVKVIFCTAYSEFAITSYELNAVDFLMKPIPFDRFVKAVNKTKASDSLVRANEVETISNDYIFVKTEQKGKMIKIDLDEIDFIEAMGNYIAFHIGSNKILMYSSMKEIEAYLPASEFMRIHKSYIIALNKIVSVENNCILLKNRFERIPLSNTYKNLFMQVLSSKLVNPK
jgi:two-component system, LytTR family, response regulator